MAARPERMVGGVAMNSFVEINCFICGKAITRRVSRINWELRKNPDYQPVCSPKCRSEVYLRKRGTCNILKDHNKITGEDPDHLTTDKIVEIMCDSTPALGSCRRPAGKGNPDGSKISAHHKGYQSSRDHVRRNTLVKKGRASWWRPLRTMSDALKVAGLA